SRPTAGVGRRIVPESEPERGLIFGREIHCWLGIRMEPIVRGPVESTRPDISLKPAKNPAEPLAIHLQHLAIN
ncbi:MAG: hypothetical protein B7Z63_00650, partial [Ignavibacteriae bacterium 37-53-5]